MENVVFLNKEQIYTYNSLEINGLNWLNRPTIAAI